VPQHVPPRIYRRVPFETAVRLRFDRFHGFVEQYSENLSLGGMFLHSDELPPLGADVTVEFRLEDGFELIRGRGRVAWVREPEDDAGPAGFGLRFLELTPGSRELIFRLVERRVREGDRVFDLDDAAPGTAAARLVHDEERLAAPPWDLPAPRGGEEAAGRPGTSASAAGHGAEATLFGRATREAAADDRGAEAHAAADSAEMSFAGLAGEDDEADAALSPPARVADDSKTLRGLSATPADGAGRRDGGSATVEEAARTGEEASTAPAGGAERRESGFAAVAEASTTAHLGFSTPADVAEGEEGAFTAVAEASTTESDAFSAPASAAEGGAGFFAADERSSGSEEEGAAAGAEVEDWRPALAGSDGAAPRPPGPFAASSEEPADGRIAAVSATEASFDAGAERARLSSPLDSGETEAGATADGDEGREAAEREEREGALRAGRRDSEAADPGAAGADSAAGAAPVWGAAARAGGGTAAAATIAGNRRWGAPRASGDSAPWASPEPQPVGERAEQRAWNAPESPGAEFAPGPEATALAPAFADAEAPPADEALPAAEAPPARRRGRLLAGLAAALAVVALGAFLLFRAWAAPGSAADEGARRAAAGEAPAAPPAATAAPPEIAASGAPDAAPGAPDPTATTPLVEPSAAPTTADALATPAPGAGPGTIERIAFERRAGGLDFEIAGAGPIAPAQVDHFRVGGEQPRLVVRIAGVERPYGRGTVEVGGPLVERVRTGFHPATGGSRAGSLHVVFDLAGSGAAATVDTAGGRVRVRIEGG
jgi:uncharacterized protein (TIGR02266 family)